MTARFAIRLLACAAIAIAAVSATCAAAETKSETTLEDGGELKRFNPVVEFQTYRAQASRDGFSTLEESLLTALAGADAATRDEAILRLVYFYMAHGLYAETLAVIREHPESEDSAELMLLAGISAYKMGRYDDAIKIFETDRLRGTAPAAPWRGMAKARLGAFKAAKADLFGAPRSATPFEDNAADFYLAQTATAIELADYQRARDALNKMREASLNVDQRAERAFLEGKLLLAQGRAESATTTFRRLMAVASAPFSSRAALELIKKAVTDGNMDAETANERVRRLLLTWEGGAFERDALIFKAMLADRIGDVAEAFRCRRRVVDKFGSSDAAVIAQRQMAKALAGLFDDKQLSPMTAAKVFYENIDLAPPGEEGDKLIRKVAMELKALDLVSDAAELLRHQVFKRLRGAQRSETAADLAALYLADNRPQDALTVLRATRLARLPEAVNDRRRWLEARALIGVGKNDMALRLLEDDPSLEANKLRGDVYFSDKAWPKAAAAYAAVADKAANDSDYLDDAYVDAALKAASAQALAGEYKTLKAFAARIEPHVQDEAARTLLHGLADEGLSDDPEKFRAAIDKYFKSAGAGS